MAGEHRTMEATIIENLVQETKIDDNIRRIGEFIISRHKLKIATDEALRVMVQSGVFYPREIAENIAYAVLSAIHLDGGIK